MAPRRLLLDFEKPLVDLEEQIEQIRQLARDSEVDVSQQLLQLETLATRRREEIFSSLTPAQKIQVARHPQRPETAAGGPHDHRPQRQGNGVRRRRGRGELLPLHRSTGRGHGGLKVSRAPCGRGRRCMAADRSAAERDDGP